MKIQKRDWKLFQEKIGTWQEAYMEKLIQEYVSFLQGDGVSSEKFWELEARIKKDRQKRGVRIAPDKNTIYYDVIRLIKEEAISYEDISEFTTEFQNEVKKRYLHAEQ